MALSPFVEPALVIARPAVADRTALFELFANRAAPRLDGVDAATLVALLEHREASQSTELLPGLAFPHAIDARIPRTLIGVALLEPELPYAAGRAPIRFCFVLFGPSDTPWAHLRTLADLARLAADPDRLARLAAARTDGELLRRVLALTDGAVPTTPPPPPR